MASWTKQQLLSGMRVMSGGVGSGVLGGGRQCDRCDRITRHREKLLLVFDDGRGLVDVLLGSH